MVLISARKLQNAKEKNIKKTLVVYLRNAVDYNIQNIFHSDPGVISFPIFTNLNSQLLEMLFQFSEI